MKNLDVEKGIVSIKGRVFDLVYLDEQQGDKAKPVCIKRRSEPGAHTGHCQHRIKLGGQRHLNGNAFRQRREPADEKS
jgi:hypothetical protein